MTYEQWKLQYQSILKNKIKQHEHGIDYTLKELDELIGELCEKGFLDEAGYWSETTPIRAAQESYQLWLGNGEEKYNA